MQENACGKGRNSNTNEEHSNGPSPHVGKKRDGFPSENPPPTYAQLAKKIREQLTALGGRDGNVRLEKGQQYDKHHAVPRQAGFPGAGSHGEAHPASIEPPRPRPLFLRIPPGTFNSSCPSCLRHLISHRRSVRSTFRRGRRRPKAFNSVTPTPCIRSSQRSRDVLQPETSPKPFAILRLGPPPPTSATSATAPRRPPRESEAGPWRPSSVKLSGGSKAFSIFFPNSLPSLPRDLLGLPWGGRSR